MRGPITIGRFLNYPGARPPLLSSSRMPLLARASGNCPPIPVANARRPTSVRFSKVIDTERKKILLAHTRINIANDVIRRTARMKKENGNLRARARARISGDRRETGEYILCRKVYIRHFISAPCTNVYRAGARRFFLLP